MEKDNVQPLSTFERGRSGIVIALKGNHRLQKRLISMGLHVGSEVEVLHQEEDETPMLIAVGEIRLALGQDMCKQILVASCSDEDPSWGTVGARLKRCFRKAQHGGQNENVFRRFRRGKQRKNCRIHKRKLGIS